MRAKSWCRVASLLAMTFKVFLEVPYIDLQRLNPNNNQLLIDINPRQFRRALHRIAECIE
jgi:hypothetical protein